LSADAWGIPDPQSYGLSQTDARRRRSAGSLGLVYPGVRRPAGECIAAFKPRAVGLPRQERHLKYRRNGSSVDRYFDYAEDRWLEI
jgi:hypothetical protein